MRWGGHAAPHHVAMPPPTWISGRGLRRTVVRSSCGVAEHCIDVTSMSGVDVGGVLDLGALDLDGLDLDGYRVTVAGHCWLALPPSYHRYITHP
jgi:hypothetical protein